ncbi:hypothetical protein PF005_g13223 [Phytophthora fragariae]|uniref:Uncharacterized protein n=2 Tax=Phytophthora TaxID=4783 RepID=A0A6A3ECN5_9STRA|nr:hypothetical protein PF003_g6363 [Phytophthora fragariae]KAE9000461.1 hypothetical protein PR002_g18180 [Phytophthora rubi]KAE8928810.1 hypothetical protein PF009_g21065 [Phytophthora fragariae]KAE9018495.1 hypothetical protein PR001_g14121 [Phytophthora rubi]KAE9098597.1 hypothetical protein PF010_g15500 [Phytophthora fragariae]
MIFLTCTTLYRKARRGVSLTLGSSCFVGPTLSAHASLCGYRPTRPRVIYRTVYKMLSR